MNLEVSELFYSIQGEGVTIGTPAIFVRLSGCNLYCDSDWTCDTLQVWKTGVVFDKESLVCRINRLLESIYAKNINLVFTGGEPLLRQTELVEIVKLYKDKHFIEVETNGTIIPDILCDMVDMFNVSPKLPNSGNRESKFYNPEALDYLVDNTTMCFKFVISKKEDIEDVHKYYKKWIDKIAYFRVYLMPACGSREEYKITAPITAELCKQYGYMFSDRLQINIWDKKTGV